MPHVQYVEVPIRAVDFRDERFRISKKDPPEALINSIRKAGLVHPPVACVRGRRYVLVTGWKRALACRLLGFRKLAVLVTPEKSDQRLLHLTVIENLATNELGLVEKATVLFKLRQSGLSESALVRGYLPQLSLPATADGLQLMLALAGAGRALQDFVSDQTSPPVVLKMLLRFPSGDLQPLLPLLRALGQNKQRQVLEHLWDIVRRDGVSVRSLFRRKRFQRILAPSRLSILQKAEGIRELLRTMRYPALSAHEEAFRAALRKARWPRGVSVQPSPFFEENSVTISFRVANRRELQGILERLRTAAAFKEMDGLFRDKG